MRSRRKRSNIDANRNKNKKRITRKQKNAKIKDGNEESFKNGYNNTKEINKKTLQ